MKIDYQESLRAYVKWLSWPHCKEADDQLCTYYQNKCRFYLDEVKEKEEAYITEAVKAVLFYVFVVPVILFMWCVIVGFMQVYNWSRR